VKKVVAQDRSKGFSLQWRLLGVHVAEGAMRDETFRVILNLLRKPQHFQDQMMNLEI
jgi:hypothetical protein